MSKHINLSKLTEVACGNSKNQRNHVILGVGLLLAVVSIAYSTSVIYIGVDSPASRIALLPQVILGCFISVYALLILSKVFSTPNKGE